MSKSNISDLSILDLQVLWAISRKPVHGYALLRILGEKRGKRLTAGTLYPILAKLKRLKHVKAKAAKGKRGKTEYEITHAGKKAMNEGCREFCAVFGDIFNMFVCRTCGTNVRP